MALAPPTRWLYAQVAGFVPRDPSYAAVMQERHVAVPTLVVHGEKDTLVGRGGARYGLSACSRCLPVVGLTGDGGARGEGHAGGSWWGARSGFRRGGCGAKRLLGTRVGARCEAHVGQQEAALLVALAEEDQNASCLLCRWGVQVPWERTEALLQCLGQAQVLRHEGAHLVPTCTGAFKQVSVLRART